MINTVVSLGAATFVVLLCTVLAIRYRSFVRRSVVAYFTDAGPALDLAIFRIVFYATSFALLFAPLSQLVAFASLPDSLIFPPLGWGWLAHVLPMQPDVVRAVYGVTIAAGVTSAIGLYTRASSIVYALGLTYVMTIPQLYGKVNHAHVVVWVAVLLAASRTADVWSVDALRRARREARAGGSVHSVPDSAAYSRPLRITWLFLGLTYFFPGVWKFAAEGLRWASPGNLRGILYAKWYELGGYQPPIPVDNSLLLVAVGLGTFFFEITFVFWLFDRRTRWISPLMGLAFHAGTNVVMRIGFYQSLGLYPAFVPWTRLLRRLRKDREPLTLTYDPRCPDCRSAVSRIAVSALPGAVTVTARDVSLIPAGSLSSPDDAKVSSHCTGLVYGGTEARLGARRALLSSPYLAWKLLPGLGRAREPFAARTHDLPREIDVPAVQAHHGSRAPLVVASVIIPLEVLAGITGTGRAWPIALYPTFAYDSRAWTTSTLRVEENGQQIDLQECFPWMPPERLGGLLSSIADSPREDQRVEVDGLVSAAQHGSCDLPPGEVRQLRIEQVTVSVDPQRAGTVLSDRTIAEVR